jgi:hypothetical protein
MDQEDGFAMKKLLNLAVVASILLFVLLPFCVVKGTETEKPSYDVTGIATIANNWLVQNADLGKLTVRRIRWEWFHITPTPSLAIGKDGWVFIASDNNLAIAEGTYPYPQKTIDTQMAVLSNLKKYYASLGADFYFLPYPSNMSVYPEVVLGHNYTVGKSPCDIITENLTQNTDIKVINPKKQLIKDKCLGQVYLKRDTHTSDMGAYSVYKTIRSELAKGSGLELLPLSVSYVDGKYNMDVNRIAGIDGLFGESQTGPVAVCKLTARQVTNGSFYDKIASALESTNTHGFGIFENPKAPNGTLLIYGTSVFHSDNIGEEYQLTRFLAENFKRVVFIWYSGTTFPAIDSIVEPDIVIAENPERYLTYFFADYGKTPIVADNAQLNAIPQTEATNLVPVYGYNGMCLEQFGAQPFPQINDCELGEQNSIVISGWAEDANTQLPLSALYLKIGSYVFRCNYGFYRPDLSIAFGYSKAADHAGFATEIPRVFFDGVSDIEFIGICTDGSYKYAPVVYSLK